MAPLCAVVGLAFSCSHKNMYTSASTGIKALK